ncbi:hypothetical protein THIARS_90271 [Thiomonas delicata]|uniref:Uncharacterized protein n=1 Tax=Thiomonas delicata TaxID=364030 RepID=A0A238DA74_THIDL|nr:hypothetical protein THIARS_90271 [Thiomonas delicata]
MGVSLRQKLRQTTGANKPVNTPFRHDLNQLASTKPGAVHFEIKNLKMIDWRHEITHASCLAVCWGARSPSPRFVGGRVHA